MVAPCQPISISYGVVSLFMATFQFFTEVSVTGDIKYQFHLELSVKQPPLLFYFQHKYFCVLNANFCKYLRM